MSAGVIAVIVVVAVLLVAALAYFTMWPRMRTNRLRQRFGPEYDRAVSEHGGDTKAAETELERRLRRHGGLKLKSLSPQARELFVSRWTGLQEGFVDAPAKAVVDANLLIGEVMRERGYPADEHDEAMDALSVHHAGTLHHYRQADAALQRARDGLASTEELREAMVRSRSLFAELIGGSAPGGPDSAAARHTTPTPANRPGSAPRPEAGGSPTTPPIGGRTAGGHGTAATADERTPAAGDDTRDEHAVPDRGRHDGGSRA